MNKNLFHNQSTKNIAKNIIDSFGEGFQTTKISLGSNIKRKIKVRRLTQAITKIPYLIILEQTKRETQQWEVAYADITLITKKHVKRDKEFHFNKDDYKYIGFDIHVDTIKGQLYKSLFIQFSYHSLVRIIERCNIQILATPTKVKIYLSSMIKSILLRCLFMIENMNDEINKYQLKNKEIPTDFFKKRESYIVTNDLFMPIVMNIGKNKYGNPAFSFTIKTVMPDTYSGAQKTIKKQTIKEVKANIFDYTDIITGLVLH